MSGPYDLNTGPYSQSGRTSRQSNNQVHSVKNPYEPIGARAFGSVRESELAQFRQIFRSNTPYGQSRQPIE